MDCHTSVSSFSDHGTEFLELSALAAYGMYDKKVL